MKQTPLKELFHKGVIHDHHGLKQAYDFVFETHFILRSNISSHMSPLHGNLKQNISNTHDLLSPIK
jgi:hypothetical protein